MMSAKILDGKILAQKLSDALESEVNALKAATGKTVRMVNVIVGDDHGACAYANSQKRSAERIGISYELLTLSTDILQQKLEDQLSQLSADPSVHAIMLHKPVPAGIDFQSAVRQISVLKDVEGLNALNLGQLLLGGTKILPCTPAAVMAHLAAIPDFSLRGKQAVVVGRSEIVGKPVALLLLAQSATVTVCHSATDQVGKLQEHISGADILVAAIGKANFVRGEWIKKGAVVIDVGINLLNGKMVGDVDFESAKLHAGFITPVPGGVGPVTVVCLMRNALEAFKLQQK